MDVLLSSQESIEKVEYKWYKSVDLKGNHIPHKYK